MSRMSRRQACMTHSSTAEVTVLPALTSALTALRHCRSTHPVMRSPAGAAPGGEFQALFHHIEAVHRAHV